MDNSDSNVSDGVAQRILLHEQMHSSFTGNIGFCTMIYFDKDGKFLGQGFWE